MIARKLWLCSIVLASSVVAEAQQPLNATDYKAAYCIGRLQNIQIQRPGMLRGAAEKVYLDSVAKITAARSRLAAFMASRAGSLDNGAVVYAESVGAEEQRKYTVTGPRCYSRVIDPLNAAQAERIVGPCLNAAGLQKLMECENPDFLPM